MEIILENFNNKTNKQAKQTITKTQEVFDFFDLSKKAATRVLEQQAKYLMEVGAFYEDMEWTVLEMLEERGFSHARIERFHIDTNCNKELILDYWNDRYNMLEFVALEFEGTSEDNEDAAEVAQDIFMELYDMHEDYFDLEGGVYRTLDPSARYLSNGSFAGFMSDTEEHKNGVEVEGLRK